MGNGSVSICCISRFSNLATGATCQSADSAKPGDRTEGGETSSSFGSLALWCHVFFTVLDPVWFVLILSLPEIWVWSPSFGYERGTHLEAYGIMETGRSVSESNFTFLYIQRCLGNTCFRWASNRKRVTIFSSQRENRLIGCHFRGSPTPKYGMIRLWSGSGIILECVDRKNQKGRLTICWYALVGQALNNLLSVSSRFSPTSSRNTSININPLIYCNHLYKPLIYIYIYIYLLYISIKSMIIRTIPLY